MLAGEVDLAVHSLKDLPTAPAEGLALAAVPARQDPRDCLVARDGLTLGELPAGSTVGTGSPRRAAQLRALGMGLEVVPVRGNVDTRLRLVADGAVDGVLLARAGLLRLGRADEATEVLDPTQMLPAPGQGALAVECRADRTDLLDALAPLDDAATRAAVTAERSVLAALEAGCSAPVGALADVAEDGFSEPELYLRAVVAAVDGSTTVRLSTTGSPIDAAALGRALAQRMIEEGADWSDGGAHPVTTRTRRKPVGTVTFVGAGPGDPGLLTVRAVEALATADTVVLDRFAREQLLVHARPDVEVLDGATDPDGAPLAQATRSRLAVEAAKAGHQVVRLMDGDPATFNGLAEEAAACVKAHVPFEVVPGVSSVSAVPAYAGVPLTGAKTRAVHVVDAGRDHGRLEHPRRGHDHGRGARRPDRRARGRRAR